MGEIVICSKSNIKRDMAKIRPILLKTLTKVAGQNDDNNGNIKDSMTFASWEISDGVFLNL